jgi:hypothetical protein
MGTHKRRADEAFPFFQKGERFPVFLYGITLSCTSSSGKNEGHLRGKKRMHRGESLHKETNGHLPGTPEPSRKRRQDSCGEPHILPGAGDDLDRRARLYS